MANEDQTGQQPVEENTTPTHIIRKVGNGTAVINIDAAVKTSRTWSSTVTSHPVETGSNISDHVTTQNPKFSISGVISDAVVMSNQTIEFEDPSLLAFLIPSQIEGFVPDSITQGRSVVTGNVGAVIPNKAQTAKLLLQKVVEDKELVTVVFKLEEYPNCVLTSFKLDKSVEIGDSLSVDLQFEQISFVSSGTTTIKKSSVVAKKAATETTGGDKPAEPVKTTLLQDIRNKVSGK